VTTTTDAPGGSSVAPDGSPVEFYRRLPDAGEAKLIHGLVRPGASILDVGCGPGRIAGPLASLGHAVTGIDNEPAMVAALPPQVEGIVADARTIRLPRTFDAVLLASHLVDDPEDGPAFAVTAARHVAASGVVIGETYPPGWSPAGSVGRETRVGDARIALTRAEVKADLMDAEVLYRVDDREWTQAFRARLLTEADLRALLAAAGLRFERWLDRAGWFVARPTSRSLRREGTSQATKFEVVSGQPPKIFSSSNAAVSSSWS
jgi:SAM-dependent methyltransferase